MKGRMTNIIDSNLFGKQKSITPIIAVVLLLMITIAIIGFAFIFFQSSFGDVTSNLYSGGLIGAANIIVKNCYASGKVTTDGDVGGGLIGENDYKTSDSFAVGEVIRGTRGSFAGYTFPWVGGSLTNVYAYDRGINCVGSGSGSGCTKKTPISYFYNKTNEPMASWDFDNIWHERTDNFPILKWQVV